MKLNTAALSVPLFVTMTPVPGSPVVTVPTAIVAAEPAVPVSPLAPFNESKKASGDLPLFPV